MPPTVAARHSREWTKPWASALAAAVGGAVIAMAALGCDQPRSPSTPPPTTTPKPKPRPAPRPPPDPMVQIASRGAHTCAVRKSGQLLCWGKNSYGQLGDGKRVDSPRLVRVPGISDATQVATGLDFTCVLQRAGTVLCWGNNEDGQLGDGRGLRPGALSLRPVRVGGLGDAVQLSAGDWHICALTRGGGVRCWGNAGNGQLGTDAQRGYAMPVTIKDVRAAAEVSSGGNHVCARTRAGIAKCWGRNTEGQLGDGSHGSRINPKVVPGLEEIVELASGQNHTCARVRSGAVSCWGDNASGQLGTGDARTRKVRTPVAVAGLTGVVGLAAGGSHTCAWQSGGRVHCWGGNTLGQLGFRSSASMRATPTVVRGISDATDLGAGVDHTCAVRRNGRAACWGSSKHGALGPYPLGRR